eukprot:CAMPEP_0201582046 /NCGR_PEP_ID=MMETSP0190_2-20130828/79322_1 /ASSEMBLY_ACC=CAM_ASM_000263 /TAXON_ID=37353 /ORGANISM="Rosalina sp." /LENGTH=30 /DNA_ID= /DNA_START= /DNA_END= /DNA_ORIENTATION=
MTEKYPDLVQDQEKELAKEEQDLIQFDMNA